MRAASLTPLLVRARDAGLSLRAEDGYVVATPKARLTPELRDEIARHKAGLLEALAWDDDAAHALIKDALAYLNEFYLGADTPDCDLSAMHAPEAAIGEAFGDHDMHLLRVAVRRWVKAGVGAVRDTGRDRGAA